MLSDLPTKLLDTMRSLVRSKDAPSDAPAHPRDCARHPGEPTLSLHTPSDHLIPSGTKLIEHQTRTAHFRLNALEMPSFMSATATKQLASLRDILSQIEEETKVTAEHVKRVEKEKEDQRTDLAKLIECPICCDPLLDPYTVSPCGHVVCFMCLRRWFNAFLLDVPAGHRAAPHHFVKLSQVRLNTCPVCRIVINRPTPLYIIRDLVEALGLGRMTFTEIQSIHDVDPYPPPEADISIDGSVDFDLEIDWEDMTAHDAETELEKLCRVKMTDVDGKLHWGGYFIEDMAKCEECGGPALEGNCLGYKITRP